MQIKTPPPSTLRPRNPCICPCLSRTRRSTQISRLCPFSSRRQAEWTPVQASCFFWNRFDFKRTFTRNMNMTPLLIELRRALLSSAKRDLIENVNLRGNLVWKTSFNSRFCRWIVFKVKGHWKCVIIDKHTLWKSNLN